MNGDAVARAAEVLGDAARRDVPLGPLTTYRVGGPAALLVEARSDADLARVATAVGASGAPVLVVGRGSNLLVADAGFAGIAVALGEPYADITLDGTTVRAGGATALPVLARRTAAAGLRGLEWAVGVPGSVGGAVRMNAGGHGSDVAATLVEVRVRDLASGHDGVVAAADLDLGYRRSALTPTSVVVEAAFALRSGDPDAAGAEVAEIVRWRREHQPGGQNAGSVFTNPEGDAAGRLVDVAGCRGLRLRTAQVSPKHANFIQADAGGSADDVAALIAEVRRRVRAATGVALRPELRMVGFGDDVLGAFER
jgi:UDP-N-acetylmuramate dehydrogenase